MSPKEAVLLPFNALGMALGIIMILAPPIQAIIEFIWWLQYAQWPGFDLTYLSGAFPQLSMPSTGLLGLNRIMEWLWDVWISILTSVLAGWGFFIFAAVLRDANKWAQEDKRRK